MAKRNDYITGREDGLLMALEIVKMRVSKRWKKKLNSGISPESAPP